MKNKKLLYSLILVAVVAAAAFAGTLAFFTATQTVEDATFVTGTLDLSVESGGIRNESINVGNMGSDGNYTMSGEQEWEVINTGSMLGRLYIELENIENINRGCNEPKMLARGYEPVITADMDLEEIQVEIQRNIDLCTEEQVGLLGEALTFVVEVDEEVMVTTNLATNSEEDFKNLWDSLEPAITFAAEEEKTVKVSWSAVPGEYGNEIQNDELKFDIKFHLTQLIED